MRVRIPAGAAGEFSSPESTLCADSYSVSAPSRCYRKDLDHCAISTGGRLHLSVHASLNQRSPSGLTMPLSGHSVETYLETSSHATCQGTFGHSRLVARYRLTDDAPLSQQSRSELTMTLSRHSVGTYPNTSSHAPCQGTFGHSRLSLLSYCELILA